MDHSYSQIPWSAISTLHWHVPRLLFVFFRLPRFWELLCPWPLLRISQNSHLHWVHQVDLSFELDMFLCNGIHDKCFESGQEGISRNILPSRNANFLSSFSDMMNQNIHQFPLFFVHLVSLYYKSRMLFLFKDSSYVPFSWDISVAVHNIIDIISIFRDKEEPVVMTFRKWELSFQDFAWQNHIYDTFFTIFMNNEALRLTELECKWVTIIEDQFFLGKSLINAERRKTEIKNSIVLGNVFKLVRIFGLTQHFTILFRPILYHNVAGWLVLFFLSHYFIKDYFPYFFHSHKLVDPSLPGIVFIRLIPKKYFEMV